MQADETAPGSQHSALIEGTHSVIFDATTPYRRLSTAVARLAKPVPHSSADPTRSPSLWVKGLGGGRGRTALAPDTKRAKERTCVRCRKSRPGIMYQACHVPNQAPFHSRQKFLPSRRLSACATYAAYPMTATRGRELRPAGSSASAIPKLAALLEDPPMQHGAADRRRPSGRGPSELHSQ
jgi:hypothetical protein